VLSALGGSVQTRTPDRAGGRTQRERLCHVRAEADAAVSDHVGYVGDRTAPHGDLIDRCRRAVQLATAAIGDHHTDRARHRVTRLYEGICCGILPHDAGVVVSGR